MLDRTDDTIVAVSSAPGYADLGIVRLSGPEAVRIGDAMATTAGGGTLASLRGWTRVAGEVAIDESLRLPADLYLFRKPRSYTRQDILEIHTIGSPAVLELVRRRALALGARPAEPGEFTARAFLSGAMDLASAQAVAGVIRARTDRQLRASRRVMDGELSVKIRHARDRLAELLGLVEADIDFSQEPIDFVTPGELQGRLGEIDVSLAPLLSPGASAERLEVLPRILLFGAPNAGKSTLMNRLSGTSRAITAAAAGTTRDILSAPVRIGHRDAILLDAVGIDRSEDEIIAKAREIALSTAQRVDAICVVIDVASGDHDHVLSVVQSLDVPRTVVAANKCDLVLPEPLRGRLDELAALKLGAVHAISALTGAGIEALREALGDAIGGDEGTTLGESVLLSERQQAAVRSASESLHRASALAGEVDQTIDCADLLAFELREALDALGTVTGEVTTEDLLAQVFANFCIGK